MRHQTKLGLVVRYLVLAGLAFIFLLPIYVIFRNAFSTNDWIISPVWHWLPNQLDLTNLKALFADPNLKLAASLGNSALVAIVQTTATLVVCMMAGYGLARWRSRLTSVLLGLTVFTLMVPAALTFVPSFLLTATLGWIDSYAGLIVPIMWSALATYLFRQAFLNFPSELEDAALLDGNSVWGAFWRVVVPNSTSTIAALGVITFLNSWNAFLWPMLVARDATRTIQVTLSRYMTSQGVDYPLLFAGALVSILPTLIVFLVLQRWLVRGTEAAAFG